MSEQPHLAFAVERVIVMCAPNDEDDELLLEHEAYERFEEAAARAHRGLAAGMWSWTVPQRSISAPK